MNRAVELDPVVLDLRLPVEGQVIGIFRDYRLGDGRLGRITALDKPRGSRSLDYDLFTSTARISGTACHQDAELGRHDVELLADVLAYATTIAATARAAMALDVDDDIDARQMRRKWTAVHSPRGDPLPAQIARSLFILFQTVRLDLFGFFYPKEKLILGKRLALCGRSDGAAIP